MTETDPEKRLIGYARVSIYGQTLDTQLSRAHLRRRRGSGISRLTDPTAVAQLWLRAGSSCPTAALRARSGSARGQQEALSKFSFRSELARDTPAHDNRRRVCSRKRREAALARIPRMKWRSASSARQFR